MGTCYSHLDSQTTNEILIPDFNSNRVDQKTLSQAISLLNNDQEKEISGQNNELQDQNLKKNKFDFDGELRKVIDCLNTAKNGVSIKFYGKQIEFMQDIKQIEFFNHTTDSKPTINSSYDNFIENLIEEIELEKSKEVYYQEEKDLDDLEKRVKLKQKKAQKEVQKILGETIENFISQITIKNPYNQEISQNSIQEIEGQKEYQEQEIEQKSCENGKKEEKDVEVQFQLSDISNIENEFEIFVANFNWLREKNRKILSFTSQGVEILGQNQLIKQNDFEQLKQWIGNPYRFELLLTTKDKPKNFSKEAFDKSCTNKGPTVIVCKVKEYDVIVGGYAHQPWKKNQKHNTNKDDKTGQSFLFNLNRGETYNLYESMKQEAYCYRDDQIFGFSYGLHLFSQDKKCLSQLHKINQDQVLQNNQEQLIETNGFTNSNQKNTSSNLAKTNQINQSIGNTNSKNFIRSKSQIQSQLPKVTHYYGPNNSIIGKQKNFYIEDFEVYRVIS